MQDDDAPAEPGEPEEPDEPADAEEPGEPDEPRDPADDEPDFSVHPLTLLAIGVVAASAYLANSVDVRCAWGLLLLLVVLPLRTRALRRIAEERALRLLRAAWGRPVKRERNPAALRRLFVQCEGAAQSASPLDDATWDDLNLDDVFVRLDGTLSTAGEYVLYEMLRTPVLDPDRLDEREREIRTFSEDETARMFVRGELARLGRKPLDEVARMLWGTPPAPHPNLILLKVQAALPLVCGAAIFLGGGVGAVLLTLAAVGFNAYSHYSRTAEILLQGDALRHLAALVHTGERLASKHPAKDGAGRADAPLRASLAEIGRLADAAHVMASKGAMVAWSDQTDGLGVMQLAGVFYEYLSTIILSEVRTYYAVLEHLGAHREDLRRLFRLVGELDALQSVACWRAELKRFAVPEIAPGRVALRIEDAVHPLLADPVPNTVDLAERSALITGSNMSGKSTFLRTVGLNVVFAQTVHTCLAASYRACPLRLASSVTIQDDVLTGRSFYVAEAERLLRLVQFAASGGPALILVDEPLRGTNSTERIAAVTEILLDLSEQEALTIAATHELKIAEMTRLRYAPYHFSDEVRADGLTFPHRLSPGVARTRNAIRLLGQLGYPADLVARADARAAAIDAGKA